MNKQPGFLHKGIYFIHDNSIIVYVIWKNDLG